MTTALHVDPQGPPLSMALSELVTLTKVSVGPMDNNSYALSTTHGCLLIDAAAEPSRLIDVLGGARCTGIITTHSHHDHIGALAQLASATGAALLAGAPDVDAIAAATGVRPYGMWDGDSVAIPGGEHLDVIGIVGHTPGSVTLVYSPPGGTVQLFTGDSLFPGGVGTTRGPDEFTRLMDDVTHKLFDRFPDTAVVHPGHGDATTLGAERPHLAEWRARGW